MKWGKSLEEKEYERGQKDGSKASSFDKWNEDWNPLSSAAYKKGFDHGAENQPQDDDSDSESGGCLASAVCVKAMGLLDDCVELTTLRWFRDNYLLLTRKGMQKIAKYYRLAPVLVSNIDSCPDAHEIYEFLFRSVIQRCVALIKAGSFEQAEDLYEQALLKLQTEF